MFENIDPASLFLIGFALTCILPLLILAVMGVLLFVFGRRAFNAFFNPDISALHRRFQQLRAAQPHASTEQLVGHIIRRQALRCGVVGAVTGLGGFITLPVALPLDIFLSLRLQAALVDFIAQVYGHEQGGEREAQIRSRLIMSGGGRVSQAATSALMNFLLRIIGKSFSKLIPFIGAAVSFAVNYAIVDALGRVALRWYGSKQPPASGAVR